MADGNDHLFHAVVSFVVIGFMVCCTRRRRPPYAVDTTSHCLSGHQLHHLADWKIHSQRIKESIQLSQVLVKKELVPTEETTLLSE